MKKILLTLIMLLSALTLISCDKGNDIITSISLKKGTSGNADLVFNLNAFEKQNVVGFTLEEIENPIYDAETEANPNQYIETDVYLENLNIRKNEAFSLGFSLIDHATKKYFKHVPFIFSKENTTSKSFVIPNYKTLTNFKGSYRVNGVIVEFETTESTLPQYKKIDVSYNFDLENLEVAYNKRNTSNTTTVATFKIEKVVFNENESLDISSFREDDTLDSIEITLQNPKKAKIQYIRLYNDERVFPLNPEIDGSNSELVVKFVAKTKKSNPLTYVNLDQTVLNEGNFIKEVIFYNNDTRKNEVAKDNRITPYTGFENVTLASPMIQLSSVKLINEELIGIKVGAFGNTYLAVLNEEANPRFSFQVDFKKALDNDAVEYTKGLRAHILLENAATGEQHSKSFSIDEESINRFSLNTNAFSVLNANVPSGEYFIKFVGLINEIDRKQFKINTTVAKLDLYDGKIDNTEYHPENTPLIENKRYILAEDIIVKGDYVFNNVSINGNNKKITQLENRNFTSSLFNGLRENQTIKNLQLETSFVNDGGFIKRVSIFGSTNKGRIENVSVKVEVGQYVYLTGLVDENFGVIDTISIQDTTIKHHQAILVSRVNHGQITNISITGLKQYKSAEDIELETLYLTAKTNGNEGFIRNVYFEADPQQISRNNSPRLVILSVPSNVSKRYHSITHPTFGKFLIVSLEITSNNCSNIFIDIGSPLNFEKKSGFHKGDPNLTNLIEWESNFTERFIERWRLYYFDVDLGENARPYNNNYPAGNFTIFLTEYYASRHSDKYSFMANEIVLNPTFFSSSTKKLKHQVLK